MRAARVRRVGGLRGLGGGGGVFFGGGGGGGTGETGGTSGRIIRLFFGYRSLIVRSSCIVGIGEVVEEEKLLLSSFF